MSELNEVEVNKKLLAEVGDILKGKLERLANIDRAVGDLKKKLMRCADAGLWDEAQAALEQTRKLSIDAITAGSDAAAAQGRVDALAMAVQRAQDAGRAVAEARNASSALQAYEAQAEVAAPEADGAPKA